MIRIITIFLILNFLAFGTSFAAGVFQITNRTYGNINDPTVTAQIDQMFNTMENTVNAQLSQFDASTYLTGTANATALASAGSTHDVANRFKYFYLSVGGGLAADLGGKSITDVAKNPDDFASAKGLSGNISLTFGVPGNVLHIPKFSLFDPENFKLYSGYAKFNQTFSDVNFEYLSYSLMGQYHFFGHYSLGAGTLKWHGMDLTTGFKYSKIKILFSKSFNETVTQDINTGGPTTTPMTMSYNTTAQLGATSSVTTIPIEVSTSVGLLYFLDFFVGLGADINAGSASSIISAPGSVTAHEPTNLLGTMSGDINFDLGQKSNAQSMSSRYLLGFALDFRVLSLTLQFNHNLTNSAEALNFGIGGHF